MAYGTKSCPKVDKVVGPGNQFVTCAKILVSCDGDASMVVRGDGALQLASVQSRAASDDGARSRESLRPGHESSRSR